MMPRTCERTGEAEERLDAQLDPDRAVDFDRHAKTCGPCAAEVAALSSLHDEMRTVPKLEAAPEAVRTERDALIEKFEHRSSRSSINDRRNAWLMFAAAALAIAAFFTERMLTRHAPTSVDVAVQAVTTPMFDVASVRDAVWQSNVEGGTVRGTLASGVASFHVEHLGPGQRFLLSLPDGDLEVRGTRFTVGVRDGATEHVDVTEGVVALHIRNSAELILRAGERWPVAVAGPTTVAAPDDDPAESRIRRPRPAESLRPTAVVPPVATASTGAAAAAPSGVAAPDAGGSAASERFVAAMAAFNAGAYGRADSLLAAFVTEFPTDPRREDAAFLRAVSHERMGDHQGAEAHARAYLKTYPSGLRLHDARRLAGLPDP